MEDAKKVLPRTVREIQAGMNQKLHIGAQLYVSVDTETVADFGLGEAAPGVAMTSDTLMAWYSSTKGVYSIAMAQQWEKGRLDIDDPVCRFIPEYAQNGKEKTTLRRLLTHTHGMVYIPGMGMALAVMPLRYKNWDEFIAKICEAPREPDWVQGATEGY